MVTELSLQIIVFVHMYKELTKVKRVEEKVELIEVRQEVRQVTEIQVAKISRKLVVEGPK